MPSSDLIHPAPAGDSKTRYSACSAWLSPVESSRPDRRRNGGHRPHRRGDVLDHRRPDHCCRHRHLLGGSDSRLGGRATYGLLDISCVRAGSRRNYCRSVARPLMSCASPRDSVRSTGNWPFCPHRTYRIEYSCPTRPRRRCDSALSPMATRCSRRRDGGAPDSARPRGW